MEEPTVRTDVLVIGAGVVGAATAYELSKMGLKVTVVDAGQGIGHGCSYANAGLLAPSHVEPMTTPANIGLGLRSLLQRDSPFHITPSLRIARWLARFALSSTPRRAAELTTAMQSLAHQSLELHRQYAYDGLATGYRETGSMDVFMTQDRFDAARESAAFGHDVRVLTPEQARTIVPGLGDIAGAIQHTADAICDSKEFVRSTLAEATKLGAQVLWNTNVTHLLGRSGLVSGARTTTGTITADHVVVSAGVTSGNLVEKFGVDLHLVGGKGYVLDLPPQAEPTMPLTFKELKVVATPFSDRLRFCGTMDLGDTTERIVKSRIEAIRRAATRGMPTVDTTQVIEMWTGQRPCTADGIPVIGASTRTPNLHFGAGHGMWGVVLAPITARLIAEGIVGKPLDPAHQPFLPLRMERPIRTRVLRRQLRQA